jgi:hypothetical protein
MNDHPVLVKLKSELACVKRTLTFLNQTTTPDALETVRLCNEVQYAAVCVRDQVLGRTSKFENLADEEVVEFKSLVAERDRAAARILELRCKAIVSTEGSDS